MKPAAVGAVACIAAFACAALPLCLLNYDHGRAFFDQLTYHYPTIVHFEHGWGISDYPSATTPGFHVLLALVARLISGGEVTLKLACFVITATLLGAVAASISRRLNDATLGVIMLLPMIFSIYVFPSGVWLLPDNLAWMTVFSVLTLAENFQEDGLWYVLCSLSLLAALLVRQSNLWLSAVIFGAAWTGRQGDKVNGQSGRIVRLTAAGLAVLPGVVLLGYFFTIWHGMTPPEFAEKHTGLNLAAVPFFLALVSFYTAFYLPLILEPLRALLFERRARYWLYLGGLVGTVAALITPTDWDPAGGRVSGLWNLARLLPALEHRSVFILLLATLGGAIAAAWLQLIQPGKRVIAATAALGFVATQLVSHFSYERYYAGLIFLLVLMMTVDVLQTRRVPAPRWSFAGPLLFAVFNAGVLAAGLAAG